MIEKREIWTSSDGKEFSTKSEAEAHEKELKDPQYKVDQRFEEFEKKFLELQGELLKLSARVECLESPWGKLNKQPIPLTPKYPDSDCNPFLPCNGKLWYGAGENLTEALNNLKEVK